MLRQGFTISPVFELWGMICEATRMLGNNINIDKRLLELLNGISTLPDVKDQSGKAINAGGGFPGVYWKDLPAFAVFFREYAIGTLLALLCGSFEYRPNVMLTRGRY